jgi:hypothetical protein
MGGGGTAVAASGSGQLHGGHRQLLSRLLVGARQMEEEAAVLHTEHRGPDSVRFRPADTPTSPSKGFAPPSSCRGAGGGGGGGAGVSGASNSHSSIPLGELNSPYWGFEGGLASSRGYPKMDISITPRFSPNELSVLLDALHADNQALPV